MPATLARPPLRRMIRPANPFAQGLIGCWTFREGAGTAVGDVSRNTHLGGGSVSGANWSWGDGPWNANGPGAGGSLVLGGTDAFVTVPAAGSALLAPQSFTIEAWVKVASVGAGSFGTLLARAGADYRVLAGAASGHWQVDVTGRLSAGAKDTGLAWTANLWQHVVLRSVPGETAFFANGVKAIFDTGSGAVTYTTNGTVQFGARTGGLFLNGSIASVRMWERPLDDAEVEALYADPWLLWARRSATIDFAALAGVPPGSAALASAATLAAAGTARASGAAAPAAASTLAAAGSATASGSAAPASVATLAASGTATAAGSAAPASVATLAAAGSLSGTGSAALAASCTLAVAGTATAAGTAAIASVATLAAAGLAAASGSAALASVAILAAAGGIGGGAALDGVATLAASGTATAAGSAAPASVATLSASGAATAPGASDLASVATLAAAGTATAAGSASLASVATLAVTTTPPGQPPTDLIDALLVMLAATPAVVAGLPGGIWTDVPAIGTPTPYLHVVDPRDNRWTPGTTGRGHAAGTLQLDVYAEGPGDGSFNPKDRARDLAWALADALAGARPAFARGRITGFLRKTDPVDMGRDPDPGPLGNPLYRSMITFHYFVSRDG